jgi:DNA-directed RNA polymerase III subunit RPC2
MERDCLLGFGASSLLLERLLISSDMSSINVCEVCGMFRHNNYCPPCKTNKVINRINIGI